MPFFHYLYLYYIYPGSQSLTQEGFWIRSLHLIKFNTNYTMIFLTLPLENSWVQYPDIYYILGVVQKLIVINSTGTNSSFNEIGCIVINITCRKRTIHKR